MPRAYFTALGPEKQWQVILDKLATVPEANRKPILAFLGERRATGGRVSRLGQ